MADEIEIVTGDVTDMEARIYARYLHAPAGTELRGVIRGPFCDKSRTLPAEFAFRRSNTSGMVEAEAVIPDPCLWTAELQHMYQVDVQAVCDKRVIAEYHGAIGLRRLAPRRPVDFTPGTG